MSSTPYVLRLHHKPAFPIRWMILGLVTILCFGLLTYSSIGIVNDFRLINDALPGLPSDFATDLDLSILFSPVMVYLDHSGDSFLRFMKYPPFTLPRSPRPSLDPIGDEIQKARKIQNLIQPSGVVPLDHIMHLKLASLEALARAIYLERADPVARRQFENGEWGPQSFAGETPAGQIRNMFQITYGSKALNQATGRP